MELLDTKWPPVHRIELDPDSILRGQITRDRSGGDSDGSESSCSSQDRHGNGTHWYSLVQRFYPTEASLRCSSVDVTGIYSHLACADEADLSVTALQLERFAEVCQFYEDRGVPTPMRHIANSSATLRMPSSHLDMVRPGIACFGVSPSAHGSSPTIHSTRHALEFSRSVFKVVRPGSSVSYGGSGPRIN